MAVSVAYVVTFVLPLVATVFVVPAWSVVVGVSLSVTLWLGWGAWALALGAAIWLAVVYADEQGRDDQQGLVARTWNVGSFVLLSISGFLGLVVTSTLLQIEPALPGL